MVTKPSLQSASMSSTPLLVIPELVSHYGAEEALMLSVLMEIVGSWQGQINVDEQRLYSRLKHQNRQQQMLLLTSLVSQNVLEITPAANDQLHINLMLPLLPSKPSKPSKPSIANGLPANTKVPSMPDTPPSAAIQRHGTMARGNKKTLDMPLSSSGGRGRDDELSRIFAAKEAEIAQQVSMSIDWQPSENILLMLKQNMSVNRTFALGLRDEFVVYYMDKGRKESPGGWEQKFLKWVKREQIQSQTNYNNPSNHSQRQHEEARYLAKEKRRQLTESILDIGNTDW